MSTKDKKRNIKANALKITMSWANTLKKVPCFILGNAPSLNNIDVNILKDYFTIGINRIFYKFDPTILMWQDLDLWLKEKKKVRQTKAIKYCRLASDTEGDFYYFRLTGTDSRLTQTPSELYGRGSSTAVAFQLAYALGCDPIVLVAIDCRKCKKTGNSDFYGNNPRHRPLTLPMCKKALKWIKDCKSGRTIINCSQNKVFETKSLEEVVKSLGDEHKGDREYWKKKLFRKINKY